MWNVATLLQQACILVATFYSPTFLTTFVGVVFKCPTPPPQPLTSPLPIGAGVGVGCWVVGICQPCGWFSVLGSLLVTVEVPGYPDTHLFLIVEAAVNLWESSVNLSFRLYLVHDTYDCQLGFDVWPMSCLEMLTSLHSIHALSTGLMMGMK